MTLGFISTLSTLIVRWGMVQFIGDFWKPADMFPFRQPATFLIRVELFLAGWVVLSPRHSEGDARRSLGFV